MLRVYGVQGKLIKAVHSFFIDIRTCVRWFPVNVGLRQGCMMSPWSFNVYCIWMVWFVRSMLGCWESAELLSANGGRVAINQLLFADNTALVYHNYYNLSWLCSLVSEFGRECERRKLRVNAGKSKVMRCSRYGKGGRVIMRFAVLLNGKQLD